MNREYIDSVRKQFEYYKMLGEKTIVQLSDEQLFWKYNEESNSIASIVKHLWGNMLSRWTDFLTTDGKRNGVTARRNSKTISMAGSSFLGSGMKAGIAFSMRWIHSANRIGTQSFIYGTRGTR
jgi:hypothetical protein